jgi:hypothetical protein
MPVYVNASNKGVMARLGYEVELMGNKIYVELDKLHSLQQFVYQNQHTADLAFSPYKMCILFLQTKWVCIHKGFIII